MLWGEGDEREGDERERDESEGDKREGEERAGAEREEKEREGDHLTTAKEQEERANIHDPCAVGYQVRQQRWGFTRPVGRSGMLLFHTCAARVPGCCCYGVGQG